MKNFDKRTKINFGISIFCTLLTAVFVFVAKSFNEFFFSFYPFVSAWIIKVLSSITSFVGFSLWELIAVLIVVNLLIQTFIQIKNRHIIYLLSRYVVVITLIVHLFVSVWGLNYYSPALLERLGYSQENYTKQDLYNLTEYYLDRANYYSEIVERNNNGEVTMDLRKCNEVINGSSFNTPFCFYINSNKPVKSLLSSNYFGTRGTTGIFICLTGESNVCNTVYSIDVPITALHEIAHRNTIAREDEANFMAFYTCIQIDDAAFQYSRYDLAFNYCYSRLYRQDVELAKQLAIQINDTYRKDLLASKEHYEKIEQPELVETNNSFYEGYLNAFEVEEGMQSYGMVVKLLLYYYYQ